MKALREAFEQARRDPAAIDAAIAAAEDFLAGNADHPVGLAYRGSLAGMKAGASLLPWLKLKHAGLAATLLDRAHERRFAPAGAADYPPDLEILLLRGIAYASFPAFLGRRAAARASLEEALRHPGFGTVPAPYRALAQAHLATLHASGDAAEATAR